MDSEALIESIDFFDNLTRNSKEISEHNDEYLRDFHFHFLNIYQSYPICSNRFFDGIIYRNFKKNKIRLKYAVADILSESEYSNSREIYPWLDIIFHYEDEFRNEKVIKSFCCQESEIEGCDIEYIDQSKESNRNKIRKLGEFQHNDAEKIYYYYLLPIIAGYTHPDSDKNEPYPYDGKYNNNKYLLEQEHIRQLKFLVFIPVYDTPIGRKLYGNFYGNLTFLFNSHDDRDEFLEKHQRKIEENLFLLVR